METQSPQINELAEALCQAQSELDIVKKSKENPFHKSKYADLAEFIKNARPILSSNGLAIAQMMRWQDGKNLLLTRLMHKSGQYIDSIMDIGDPVAKRDKNGDFQDNIQALGSRITYIRRYEYAAILGTASSNEDDDAEEAMQRHIQDKQQSEKKIDQLLCLTLDQVEEIKQAIGDDHILMTKILAGYSVQSPLMLKQKNFPAIMNRIKELNEEKKDAE